MNETNKTTTENASSVLAPKLGIKKEKKFMQVFNSTDPCQ